MDFDDTMTAFDPERVNGVSPESMTEFAKEQANVTLLDFSADAGLTLHPEEYDGEEALNDMKRREARTALNERMETLGKYALYGHNAEWDAQNAALKENRGMNHLVMDELSDDDRDFLLGSELADTLAKGDTWGAAERMAELMPADSREAYLTELRGCEKETDMFRLMGRTFRADTRGKFDRQQAWAEKNDMLARRWAAGDDFDDTFTEADVDAMIMPMPDADYENMTRVREFMRDFVRPLEQQDDYEEAMRRLDGMEDALLDLIGEDEGSKARADIATQTLMSWAQKMARTNRANEWNEVEVAVGKMLSNWMRFQEQSVLQQLSTSNYLPMGAPSMPVLVEVSDNTKQWAAERNANRDQRDKARGTLRLAVDEAMKAESAPWYRKMTRGTASMFGETLPYLLPNGMLLGTTNLMTGGAYEQYTKNLAQGMESGEAFVNAYEVQGLNAAVEALPWNRAISRIGGTGLNATFGRFLSEDIKKGIKPGWLTRRVAAWSSKGVWRAAAAETLGSFVDEGVLEPLAQGFLQYGTDHALDMLGVKHGETKGFWDDFDELQQIWTNPTQLGALMLFSAAMTGAYTPQIKKQVEYFAANRNFWITQGLTEKQADAVVTAENPWEEGRKVVQEAWAKDADGMRQRRLDNTRKFAEQGGVLVLTGAGSSDPDLNPGGMVDRAAAAVWQDYVDRGILPQVERTSPGMVRLTRKDGSTLELTDEKADVYLLQALNMASIEETRKLQEMMGGKAEAVNLRQEIANSISTIAGRAGRRAVEQTSDKTGVEYADVLEGLPSEIKAKIEVAGGITYAIAEEISQYALGQIDEMVAGGASLDAARNSVGQMGRMRSLGTWADFARDFAARAKAGNLDLQRARTTINRSSTRYRTIDGKRVMGQVLMGNGGTVNHYGILEDLTESFADQMLDERAQALQAENEGMSYGDARAQALKELHGIVKAARDAVLKTDPKARIENMGETPNYTEVVEALSTMALSQFATGNAVPAWMRGLSSALAANLQMAADVNMVRAAYANALKSSPDALAKIEQLLDKLGVQVRDVMREAQITEADIQAWKNSVGVAQVRADGPMGSGGASVSNVVQDAEQEEQDITEREKEEPVKESEPTTGKDLQDDFERHAEPLPEDTVPENMRGVFTGGCVFNAAGGYFVGLIDKTKLRDGTEQVKKGAKGKHGVIAGRELTGNFQASAAPLYVWKRKNGELQVISGRHRFELMMRDDTCTAHLCYVSEENEEHNETWARMTDYENNMRDDQADELTAATYVRETGYSDEVLRQKGLLRNASRSKRGALIGREARQDLWDRFNSGAVDAKDAEIICNLTKNIRDAARIEDIQARCCQLLEQKKSWEYIGAMVQLMANKEAVVMRQGLLDLGADFESDLNRAATWIEKNLAKINEAITLLKQGRKMSEKKRKEAERLGISVATTEGTQEMLQLLNDMKSRFEFIGSYPDMVAQASLYDGESEVDPVGQMLEQAQRDRAEMAEENAMSDDELLEKRNREIAAQSVPTLFQMSGVKVSETSPVLAKRMITADAAKEYLKQVQGKTFYNEASDVHAKVVQKTIGKSHATQMTVANLTRLGFSKEDARVIHYSSFAHIHELFERAKDYFFEENYDAEKKRGRAGAWHYFGTVNVEGYGVFDVNVTALKPENKKEGNRVFSLELTVENPSAERLATLFGTGPAYNAEGLSERNLSAYRSIVEKEMMDIRKKAEEDGDLLMAPNGKPTNLTERQWLQVRTKAFKKWFGDWENAPANASKLLDENGEPRVVYHETSADFTVFDTKRVGGAGEFDSAMPHGIFLKPTADGIGLSGDRQMQLFARIERPLEFENREEMERYWRDNVSTYQELYNAKSAVDKEYAERFKQVEDEHRDLLLKLRRRKAAGEIDSTIFQQEAGKHEENVVEPVLNEWSAAIDEVSAKMRDVLDNWIENSDYDGIILNHDVGSFGRVVKTYLVFHPNQIKSATHNRGTFDGENADITFSMTQTDTPQFKAWFGKSKAVGKDGKPRVMYHGTTYWKPIKVFKKGKTGYLGPGIYVTPEKLNAQSYADKMGVGNGSMYALYVRAENPLYITYDQNPAEVIVDMVNRKGTYAKRAAKQSNANFIITKKDLEKLAAMGYDSIAYGQKGGLPMAQGEVMVFSPNQVKSATQNNGDFSRASDNITFSMDSNLAAAHTLSVDKFLAVAKLGGMPVPSIAITRLDKPYSWGGDDAITLIGIPKLGQPGPGNRIYLHDAYTGTMPQFFNKKKNTKKLDKMVQEKIKPALASYGMDSHSSLRNSLFRNDNNENVVERSDAQVQNNDALAAYWAITEKGYTPKPKMQMETSYAETWNRYDAATKRKLNAWAKSVQKELTDADIRKFCAIMRDWFTAHPLKLAVVQQKILNRYADAEVYLDDFTKYSTVESAIAWYGAISRGETKAKRVPDVIENARMFRDYAEKNRAEFGEWAKKFQTEYVGDSFFKTRRQKTNRYGEVVDELWELTPATLTNLTRYMRQEKARGGEQMSMTPGLFLALMSAEMKGKRDVAWNRDRIVSSGEFKAINDEYEDKFSKFYDAVYNARKYKGYYSDEAQTTLYRVAELRESGKSMSDANIAAAIRSNTSVEWTDELVQQGVELVQLTQTMPTDYMEAIPMRAVKLDEFRYAIMPESLRDNAEVNAVIEDSFMEPIYHDGTREGYEKAMASLVGTYVSFQMTDAALGAMDILRGRENEVEGTRLINAWQEMVNAWSGKDVNKLGGGYRAMAEMRSLIAATRAVLPKKYARMGNLIFTLQWAEVYSTMADEGKVPMSGAITSPIFEQVRQRMAEQDELNRLNGLTDEEAADVLRKVGGMRMEHLMRKVAFDCRTRLERWLKDQERERIETMIERMYPKREPGKKSPRGKMDADTYRQVEKAHKLFDMDANKVADIIDANKALLAALKPDDADYEERQAQYENEIYMASLYGNWFGMSLDDARRAVTELVQLMTEGRTAWEKKLQEERNHTRWLMKSISKNFKVSTSQTQAVGAGKQMDEGAKKGTMLKKMVVGNMSLSHMLIMLRPVLGKDFCDRHRRMLAEHHKNTLRFNNELRAWMFDTLSRITGLKTEDEMQVWMNNLNQRENTGIRRKVKVTHSVALPIDEARRWVEMSKEEREAERKRIAEENEAKEQLDTDIPLEEHILPLKAAIMRYEMGAKYAAMSEEEREETWRKEREGKSKEWIRRNNPGLLMSISENQRFVKAESSVTEERDEIVATKEGILYTLLLLEQDDYAHLAEPNGLTEENVNALRDYVGKDVMAWGYAMRDKLIEQGKDLRTFYEAYTGVPLASNPRYFPGAFKMEATRNASEAPDQQAGAGGGITGGKMGCLIARRKHNRQFDWLISASSSFWSAMQQQFNYVSVTPMTREWKNLLNNGEFSRRLEAEVGPEVVNKLTSWVEMLDGAQLQDGRIAGLLARFLRPVLGFYALSRLAGNVYTWVKQSSGIIHGFIGGYVPDKAILNGKLNERMTYHHIGFGEYIGAFAKCLARQNVITMEEIKDSDYIKQRAQGKGRYLEEVLRMKPLTKVAGKTGRWAKQNITDRSMDVMENIDRNANAVAMLALVNAIYDRAMVENADGMVPEEAIKKMAIETAGIMIDEVAQPKLRTQKSHWAASNALGGVAGDFIMLFKSESLNKLSVAFAQGMSGEGAAALAGYAAFGSFNALVLWAINWVRGQWSFGDDDKSKTEWWQKLAKFGFNTFTADLSALPIVGEAVGRMESSLFGGYSPQNSLLDSVFPATGFYNAAKREVKAIAKGDSAWDQHLQNVTNMTREAAACGAYIPSVHGTGVTISNLLAAVATVANMVRAGKDVVKNTLELAQ